MAIHLMLEADCEFCGQWHRGESNESLADAAEDLMRQKARCRRINTKHSQHPQLARNYNDNFIKI